MQDRFDVIQERSYNGCGCTMDHNLNQGSLLERKSNAGGYGFWCNKKCAERKDEEIEAERELAGVKAKNEADMINIVQGYLTDDGSIQRGTTGSNTGQTVLLILGGLLIVTGVGYGIYKITKKK